MKWWIGSNIRFIHRRASRPTGVGLADWSTLRDGSGHCVKNSAMALQRYADRCNARRVLLGVALERVVAALKLEPEVRAAFVFGSFATDRVGPLSDLDVLVVRDTTLGIVDRVADLKLAARGPVPLDLIVVTPEELETTFRRSSFGATILRTGKLIYAA